MKNKKNAPKLIWNALTVLSLVYVFLYSIVNYSSIKSDMYQIMSRNQELIMNIIIVFVSINAVLWFLKAIAETLTKIFDALIVVIEEKTAALGK